MPVAKKNQQLLMPLTPHGLSVNSALNGTVPIWQCPLCIMDGPI